MTTAAFTAVIFAVRAATLKAIYGSLLCSSAVTAGDDAFLFCKAK
jgi:hypothetical protein